MSNSDITMTYSSVLTNKQGKKIVRVQFTRNGTKGPEVAEGLIPDGVIQKQNGYSPKEIGDLETYLRDNADDIMVKAKKISNPLKWL